MICSPYFIEDDRIVGSGGQARRHFLTAVGSMFNALARTFIVSTANRESSAVIPKHLSYFLTTGGGRQHWMLLVGAAVFKGAQKSSDG
jgi:hypothetical protein